ncbi:type IV secretory pathway TraG/TraD family ATPase VirD4 [Frondihabitans sp. PhB188]|uniref:type IV secretory system conjugative DNA transfer family protein n=1 Tax=Frondihabitans sp. PhB188 TaxID=2485200 RepID=UPI000F477660|nr:TraM recognition domain-containing protein [Frondihabitans sp. PhB188]ROQ30877.1 type IV secretory pathway TraG/TraD family ATPase VirD4 [Frondihabitans sp. PhB188]
MNSARTNVLVGSLFALLLGAVYLAIHTGAAFSQSTGDYPWNPVQLLGDMVLRGTPLPKSAPVFMIVFLIIAVAAFTVLLAWQARRAANKRGNVALAHMASKTQTKVLRAKQRTKETARLHPNAVMSCGQSIGRMIGSRAQWVYQGWRETGVYVFGTGRGKTSAFVIRHCLEAPGACVMTSNKVDGVREVIAGRKDRGTVYLFDPNRIYRDELTPDFVYNPLSDIETLEDAAELAMIFEASTRGEADKGGDAQFDTDGRDLLSALLLAAAVDDMGLATVYRWLSSNFGQEAQVILNEHGLKGVALTIGGVLNSAEKTKQSTFSTARRMASALKNDRLVAWTDTAIKEKGSPRSFDPAEFVQGKDTLVLLSKDGAGSGGAILTALVRAIGKKAERAAQRNGGRLTVPLVMELDECANIVRWPELPSLYSFYGSMGIILNAYFQSKAQGVEAFGRGGWQALWDAAANRVYGGGVADPDFLGDLVELIGKYDETTYGTSTGRDGQMSSSTSTRQVNTLDVDKLANLPEWRVVMFNSKCRPVMLTSQPWFRDRELKAQIDARARVAVAA